MEGSSGIWPPHKEYSLWMPALCIRPISSDSRLRMRSPPLHPFPSFLSSFSLISSGGAPGGLEGGVGDGRRVWAVAGGDSRRLGRRFRAPQSANPSGGAGCELSGGGGRQAPRRHWMRRLARRVPETFFFLFLCYFSFFFSMLICI